MAVIGAGSSIGGLGGSAVISRLLVVISGNTSQLDAALAGAKGGLAGFNSGAARLGSALTRSVTLPILGLGGVALKLASDFDTAMARVQGLTTIAGKSGYSIDELKGKLLDLAQVVPTSPTELANSLYYAGSAGLDAATSMEVVEASAKGAAIGMGSAADIAKVLIFALNNYGKEGLTAAHAMDVLTEGIKRGTAEPEEMAIALGRVLPVAQDAGIAFDTVVASIAALTNIGLPTRVATTSLRALFTELLAPTIQATEKLDELGISSQQLRDTLRAGPIPAFQLLLKATHGNVDALHDIIPQIRGFTAFSGLSGEKLRKYAQTINHVTDSTGALNKAFRIMARTSPAFQFEIGLNKLRVAGIEMGEKLIPVLLKVVQVIGDVGDALAAMPGWAQSAMIGVGLLAAALGPLLKLWAALNFEGRGLFMTGKSAAVGITTMAVAALAAVGGFSSLTRGSHDLFSILSTSIGTFAAVALALKGVSALANAGALGVNALSLGLASMSAGTIAAVAIAIAAVVTAIGILIGHSHDASREVESLGDALVTAGQSAKTFKELISTALDNSKVNDEVRGIVENLAKVVSLSRKGTVPLQDLHKTFMLSARGAQDTGDALLRMYDSLRQSDGGIGDFDDNMRQATAALEEFYYFSKKGKDVDLDKLFKQHGTNIDDFAGMIETIGDQISDPATQAGFKELAKNTLDLAVAADATGKGYNKLKAITLGQIVANQTHDMSVQELAKHFGVSTDYMEQSLQDYGTTAENLLGSGGKVVKAWGRSAGFIDQKTGEIVGHQKEMREATEKIAQDMSKALAESFSIFDKAPTKIKQDTSKIVAHVQDMSRLMLREAENVQTLAARGVPTGLIGQLIGQGPQMVQKFVDSTKPELKKLISAYEVTLGATDAAILKEASHQETKGKDMVAGFVTAILSMKSLPVAAAHRIVNSMVPALTSGKVKPAGANFIRTFALAIGASGLPRQKAGQAVQGAVQALLHNHGMLPAGHAKIMEFAQGIAKAAGIPVAKAHSIMVRVAATMRSAENTYSIGLNIAQNLARGIEEGSASAFQAAKNLANEVQSIISGSMYGSPRYFTYYLGRDLIGELNEGIKHGIKGGHPAITADARLRYGRAASVRDGRGSGTPKYAIIEGNVIVDGMESRMRIVAREEATAEMGYRGF